MPSATVSRAFAWKFSTAEDLMQPKMEINRVTFSLARFMILVEMRRIKTSFQIFTHTTALDSQDRRDRR
jgi:hypothetical protein